MAKKRILSWAPVRAQMKKVGAEMVSREAVDELIRILVDDLNKITTNALKIAKHSGRKKITKGDIKLAIGL